MLFLNPIKKQNNLTSGAATTSQKHLHRKPNKNMPGAAFSS